MLFALALFTIVAPTRNAYGAPGDLIVDLGFPSASGIAAASDDGGMISAGTFFGSVDFGGGTLSSLGMFTPDVFVAVLTVAGGHVFSAIHGDASNDQAGNDIGIDALGQVVVAGGMQGSVDFGGGVPLASAGQADIYVARYDGATGAHQWSSVLGSATSEIVNDLSQDGGGNLVISGNMSGSFDAGGGALPFDTFSDLFVVSLDSSGNHQWSAGFGTAGFDYFAGNAVDGSGNVLLFGGAGNGIDFGAGALADASLYLARFVPEPDLASMILVGTIFLGCVSRSTAGRGVTVDRPS